MRLIDKEEAQELVQILKKQRAEKEAISEEDWFKDVKKVKPVAFENYSG